MQSTDEGSPQSHIPEPVPPVYARLKDLHLTTALVSGGEPRVAIITPASGIYDAYAARLQSAIEAITGARVPIASDDSAAGAVPITGNLIALGNRSTNQTIGQLYDLYYCVMDLKYPGPGGYNVRSLHSPFGDGRNVILVGGSDTAGVKAATEAFLALLHAAGGSPGNLSVGHLMEIRLGAGNRIEGRPHWDAGQKGSYGWNTVSEHMAMYYLTGQQCYAREMLRYAFPDEQTREEMNKRELIGYHDSPLAGSEHYHVHLMTLFWDLIEDSSVFSDEERLQVTNAIARQLSHRKGEGVYQLTPQTAKISHRDTHWAYSALCLYCLGRYFQKDYPEPVWHHCMRAAGAYYTSLHEDARFGAGNDNLFWYCSEVEPILTYMVLSGYRRPLETGALQELLRGQEILISGRPDDWALREASISYLHKAAYLTQDGRWVAYRERTGLDMNVLRVGQSFWPEEHLAPSLPVDLVDTWTINHLPEPHWSRRNNGFAREESFYFDSFRSAPDGSGDFILLDGYNGQSRNPYHAFAVLELRIAGQTLLKGYRNQVLVSADGLMEPRLAMDGALKYADVVGDVAVVVGEVPAMSWSTWRRTLAQRIGRYALVIDRVRFRAASTTMAVETLWETTGDTWDPEEEALEIPAGDGSEAFEVRMSDLLEYRRDPVPRFGWYGAASEGDEQIRFSLIARRRADVDRPLACLRVAENAAALALPQAALAVAGTYGAMAGEMAILAEDHLVGHGLQSAGLGERLLAASKPLGLIWDFAAGSLEVVATEPVELALAVDSQAEPRRLQLPAGRHRIANMRPPRSTLATLRSELLGALEQGRAERAAVNAAQASGSRAEPAAPALRAAFSTTVGGAVTGLMVVPTTRGPLIHAAVGKTVHQVLPDGCELPPLQADGDVRVMTWWAEHRLLLVGCADEQVIAFDESGNRRWVFVSKMDLQLYRTGDDVWYWWYKSWPGLGGIHGLHTGRFLGGKSQAFVGSTCTLEIIDERGALVRRLPILRGPVHKFALLHGERDQLSLLMARQPSDWDNLAVIDNVDCVPRQGFHDLPPGHQLVWAWMQMRPVYLACTDLDGDGREEVLAAIDGVWNRVSVWDRDGTPRANVNFPPGERPLCRNLPGVDAADLNGDGKAEILVATAGRVLVALDHTCQRIWSKRLAAVPTVLKAVPASGGSPPWVLVGGEDGSVAAFDGDGRVVGQGRVEGRPLCAEAVPLDAGSAVVIGTDVGQVTALAP